ncbi:MAG: NAD-dependent epimerase/dehydratase family protein [Acidimicrobiales bacterium]
MRVVVVGATGNVGTSVIEALSRDSSIAHIIGLARRPPGPNALDIEWRQVDITTDPLHKHFRGVDAVIHLAWTLQPARHPRIQESANIQGAARVFEEAAASQVGALLYASSFAAYSPGPDSPDGNPSDPDRRLGVRRLGVPRTRQKCPVDESWPVGGIATSAYSRQKAQVERLLDRFEQVHQFVRVVRLRPGLTFKAGAGPQLQELFASGTLVGVIGLCSRLRIMPVPPGIAVPVVHTDDVAEAYRLALLTSVTGAYNIAADPALDVQTLARAFNLRQTGIRNDIARGAASRAWQLHATAVDPGWLDLALRCPALETRRARRELDWKPGHSALDAVRDLVEGMRGRPIVPPLLRYSAMR